MAWYRLRNWALRLLAGRSPVMMNCCVDGDLVVAASTRGGYFCGNAFKWRRCKV